YRTTLPPHGSVMFRVTSKRLIGSAGADARPHSTVNVVFVGDSITQGAGLPDPDLQAPPTMSADWLRQRNPGTGIFVANEGRAGHTTVDVLPASHTDFPEIERAATQLMSDHPGRLMFSIMLGTNDSAINGPLGSPVSPRDYRNNLTMIIDRLLQDYPASQI